MEFDRDVYASMHKWKADCATNKVALEIKGARQIGKTHSVRKFGRDCFRAVHELNLKDPLSSARIVEIFGAGVFGSDASTVPVFPSGTSVEQLLKMLFPDFRDEPDVLLFFDEVQESAYFYNLIRPINRQLKCQLIVSGSFLGRVQQQGFFIPVGDSKAITMRSLSFPEFLGAVGLRSLYDSTDLYGGSDPENYAELYENLKLYLRIGGHPKVVEQVLLTKSIDAAYSMLDEVVTKFCEESAEYSNEVSDIVRLRNLLHGVASLMLREGGRYSSFSKELGKIVGEKNRRSVENALSWFWQSGILEPCARANNCDPMNITPDCRFYFTDPGIAHVLYRKVSMPDSQIFGNLCAGFAYACVRDIKGLSQASPLFATHGDGELDFIYFVRSGGKVVSVGIEVKGGNNIGKTANRLLQYGLLDYLVNAKGTSKGGRLENVFTIPLALLGRFNIFDFIENDDAKISDEMVIRLKGV